jgi:hypothetical protein
LKSPLGLRPSLDTPAFHRVLSLPSRKTEPQRNPNLHKGIEKREQNSRFWLLWEPRYLEPYEQPLSCA